MYAGDMAAEDDPEMRRKLRTMFSGQLRGNCILEVGCGPGTDAAKFAEQGLNVTATDFSRELVDIVKQRYPAMSARVMDMMQPDFPAQSFDGIYAFSSFLHIPREFSLHTLQGLRELLVPDGLLALQLIESLKGVEQYWIVNWAGKSGCNMLFTCHTREDISRLLIEAGYVSVVIEDAPYSQVCGDASTYRTRYYELSCVRLSPLFRGVMSCDLSLCLFMTL